VRQHAGSSNCRRSPTVYRLRRVRPEAKKNGGEVDIVGLLHLARQPSSGAAEVLAGHFGSHDAGSCRWRLRPSAAEPIREFTKRGRFLAGTPLALWVVDGQFWMDHCRKERHEAVTWKFVQPFSRVLVRVCGARPPCPADLLEGKYAHSVDQGVENLGVPRGYPRIHGQRTSRDARQKNPARCANSDLDQVGIDWYGCGVLTAG
jgi:hypothetical protein